jgi:nucleotide-binding universal stress UspA family protein
MKAHPVLAGYSGLDSASAVQLGALLARLLGEPLVLATAYRYEPAALSARALPDPENARRAEAAEAALHRARLFAGRAAVVRELAVPAAGVPDALAGLAREVDACMLVVGRDDAGRVTRTLLPRAPCPVAVAPLSVPLAPGAAIERIGVAYDGSPMARWALVAAIRLAIATDARIVLLAAGPTTEHAATWLHLGRLALAGEVPCESRTLTGDAPAALARTSEDLDLLVCGSRGRGRPVAAILGSVSLHLVSHAHCPVIVVPPVVASSPARPLGLTTATVDA